MQRARRRARCDIAVLDSPPRVAAMASEYGMKAGISLDLDTGTDFEKREDQSMAMAELRSSEPRVLIGFLPCTDFSVIQNINRERMGEVEWQRRQVEALGHLKFA